MNIIQSNTENDNCYKFLDIDSFFSIIQDD
jgi:hypothetical protein